MQVFYENFIVEINLPQSARKLAASPLYEGAQNIAMSLVLPPSLRYFAVNLTLNFTAYFAIINMIVDGYHVKARN